MSQEPISERSRRIARNTVFLYLRMLVMLLIGLFTSRVVLKQLGVENYGIYNVVGSVVTLATIITDSSGTAVGRYIANALGGGDMERMRRIFSSSVWVQLIMSGAFLILIETVGLWYLNSGMDIPAGRLGAANWTLQCSAASLVVQLLSTPYNQTIIAHERMDVYAYISILEAILKLSIALLLMFSPFDKLKVYALLILISVFVVRLAFVWFCRSHFKETRGRLSFDKSLTKEMATFAGWNFLGSGVYVADTHGINILLNWFFGVTMNAARGIASQVDSIVRRFATNVLLAFNPQITKSFASGERDYACELVCKGAKYTWLIILFFALPFCFEARFVLHIWLGEYPAGSVIFSQLALAALAVDLGFNTLVILVQAGGEVKKYYIVTSLISILAFPLAWLSFIFGLHAYMAYIAFIAAYLIADVAKLFLAHSLTGLNIGQFLSESVLKVAAVLVIAIFALIIVRLAMPSEGWLRLIVVVGVSCVVIAASSYFIAFTAGERNYLKSFLKPHRSC